ncbi:hypothetical protein BJF90_01020 [Pseudonocardia sp. CNS-004]|nr:hypothetical protein BJF90_01020 [Pseudonocardia sp. CNS-004]
MGGHEARARGQFDMCRNGRCTERGIKERDGCASGTWVVEPGYAVKLDPGLADVGMLLEPAGVVAKAWDSVDLVGSRANRGRRWSPAQAHRAARRPDRHPTGAGRARPGPGHRRAEAGPRT